MKPRSLRRTSPAAVRHQGVIAAIFDLDGVLADTATLHYRSWRPIADELGLSFNLQINDRMRGRSRSESLAILLGDQATRFTDGDKRRLTDRKNDEYLRLVAQMTSRDLFPGVIELLRGLRERDVLIGVASSSRNAGLVIEQLGLDGLLDGLTDANTAPRSKPDPQVFLAAAQILGVRPARCVVVEDGEAGVAAALAAGMKVVGIGPPERVGQAHLVVKSISELRPEIVVALVDTA